MKKDKIEWQIGSQMRSIRKAKNLTLEHVGKHLEVAPQQVQKYEVGETAVPFCKLVLFCKSLNVDPAYFIPLDANKPSSTQQLVNEYFENNN